MIQTRTEKFELMVKGLRKPAISILETLTPERVDLIHMAMGVAGEAGELLDMVKKHVAYDKPLDREKLILELGDIEFYLEGVRQILDIERGEVLAKNIEKLSERYNNLIYSDEAAINRKDVK